MKPPVAKILLRPLIVLHDKEIDISNARLLECARAGMLHQNTYYRFSDAIHRTHLKSLIPIRDMTLPQPLFRLLCRECIAPAVPLRND